MKSGRRLMAAREVIMVEYVMLEWRNWRNHQPGFGLAGDGLVQTSKKNNSRCDDYALELVITMTNMQRSPTEYSVI